METTVFQSPRHGNVQAYNRGNVIRLSRFLDTNLELGHSDFIGHLLFENNYVEKGGNGQHHIVQSKFIGNKTDNHDPNADHVVQWNNEYDSWNSVGGGVRFGGLNINDIFAYNTLRINGRRGWTTGDTGPFEVFDFCRDLVIIGNKAVSRNPVYGFQFVPGFSTEDDGSGSPKGQTGIGTSDIIPGNPERYSTPRAQSMAPIMQSEEVLLSDNTLYNIIPGQEIIGFGLPVEKDNTFLIWYAYLRRRLNHKPSFRLHS